MQEALFIGVARPCPIMVQVVRGSSGMCFGQALRGSGGPESATTQLSIIRPYVNALKAAEQAPETVACPAGYAGCSGVEQIPMDRIFPGTHLRLVNPAAVSLGTENLCGARRFCHRKRLLRSRADHKKQKTMVCPTGDC